ncbi:MAG: SctD/MshK family protein [Janthinobacterium lividum]
MIQPCGTLIIQSSLHGKIRIPLGQTLVIGRSVASDIVVADASLASSHIRLDINDFPIIRLEALDADISFGNNGRLAAGDTCVLSKSTDFYAGEVAFNFELHGVVDDPPSVVTRNRLLPALLIALILGSAILSTTEGSPLLSEATQTGAASPLSLSVDIEPRSSDLPMALRANAELKHLELDGIALDSLSDGAMRASGALFEAQASRWADFKKWLDAQSSGKLVLVDTVTTGSKLPSLAIQSAWLGEAPYVIDGQGDKLFVGADIENGWIIQSIEPGRVNLRRGRQQMAVRF